MKIMIINPDYGMTREEMDLRCGILSKYVAPDTELTMECLTETRVTIDSSVDVVMAGPEIIKRAIQAEKDGYDAVVLYCFSDPVIDACREAVSIPVTGGGQSACLTSVMLGYESGLIITDKKRIAEKRAYRYRTGIRPDAISVIRAVDISGVDVWKEPEKTIEILAEAGRDMVDNHGVQTIILGCLTFLGLAQQLSQIIGVPVVDGAVAAVSMAESLVRQKVL